MADRVTTRGSSRLKKADDEFVDKENAPPPPDFFEAASKAAPSATSEVSGRTLLSCGPRSAIIHDAVEWQIIGSVHVLRAHQGGRVSRALRLSCVQMDAPTAPLVLNGAQAGNPRRHSWESALETYLTSTGNTPPQQNRYASIYTACSAVLASFGGKGSSL